ncbi:TPA: tRNA (N6-isopentenyl adenosine(37)-C2)-methylthiotransferase MiaB [Candidatus Poribacteria bacterium]|nr:tRNA (N6-isopentenyl adenosine(37)-C2)-methylthiotransferase MiaB [Candidatus Poribacteria bacterium]HIA67320.1 tRNA (N6-isopentenyl adenosine(37)-C2)-methylthiotransferase MiaB [Candidatus Poribacteria bacterium]HIB86424.1 tRNA (N6-isopentenyl adenosine(37)-C2)-methylthiotransferase MiaB [Candidatus Poribacteria bacterium]HIC03088.1 tRNA (N6-isopentenyl adenosine(37)-C2)-methylthiotransferase MiaB [Candidatus Poribacteria bacterium]HIC18914.1 tRNA (N6-isopentenyl adenosine(37)-C2)-methylthi
MKNPLPLYNRTSISDVQSDLLQSNGTAYIETYGCQMNVSDSELMAGILTRAGYKMTDDAESANVILINTCAIRENAEEKVLNRLKHLNAIKRRNPNMVLGICGCMAQHMRTLVLDAAPYIDLVLGPDAYRSLPQAIASAKAKDTFVNLKLDKSEDYADLAPIRKDGIRAWLTIQRGCDKMCTFCVVPFTRGRERSLSVPMLVREIKFLVDEGFKEVVLLGQTVNSYHDGTHNFGDLLFAINQVEGIERIRFTSPHPSDATKPMIDAIASCKKVCKQIHLPLQSGSTRILSDMHRTYTVDEYRELVFNLRNQIPNLAISTDIIVGFCGETEEDFQQTHDLMGEMRYDSAFMFKYSDRDGTLANRTLEDNVPEEEKIRRLQSIIDLQYRISHEINQERVGQTVEILVEGESRKSEADYFGKDDTFKTTVFPRQNTKIGDTVNIKVHTATAHTLIGDVIS